jgi:hypothetical protein
VLNQGTDASSVVRAACHTTGTTMCVPLNSGYEIKEHDFIYVNPGKDFDVSKLNLPKKARGIVV